MPGSPSIASASAMSFPACPLCVHFQAQQTSSKHVARAKCLAVRVCGLGARERAADHAGDVAILLLLRRRSYCSQDPGRATGKRRCPILDYHGMPPSRSRLISRHGGGARGGGRGLAASDKDHCEAWCSWTLVRALCTMTCCSTKPSPRCLQQKAQKQLTPHRAKSATSSSQSLSACACVHLGILAICWTPL